MAERSAQLVATANGVAGTAPAGPVSKESRLEGHAAWPMICRLPVLLEASIPLSGLRVRDLLELRSGQTIESAWASPEDVPLKAGTLQIAWGEFEVVEQRMALRVTRLA